MDRIDRFRSYCAWALLVVMALAIVPRELLHDCDPAHNHGTSDQGAHVKAHCQVCDVAVPLASAVEAEVVHMAAPMVAYHAGICFVAPSLDALLLAADRGPPSFC